jgi:basic membrane lipoprotein Med (substrate-binding protein (PBP1-ABC) superfamily)
MLSRISLSTFRVFSGDVIIKTAIIAQIQQYNEINVHQDNSVRSIDDQILYSKNRTVIYASLVKNVVLAILATLTTIVNHNFLNPRSL